jgi:hypothetical protein
MKIKENTKRFFAISLASLLSLSSMTYANEISEFTIPFNHHLNAEGSVQIHLNSLTEKNYTITKSFYGADTFGFSELPSERLVSPLKLGVVRLGGSLHSVYNWKVNAYYDHHDHGVFYVYSPLVRRIKLIQHDYLATPMFQVNMLGWQPDFDANGRLTYQNTADAKHAADAITYLNGTNKLALQHVLMGNEPFDAYEVHGKKIPSADEYIDSYIKYAVSLRNAQENVSGNSNDIKLWGPEIATGWTGWQTTHPSDCVFDGDLPAKMKCSYGKGQFTEFMPYFLKRLAEFEKDPLQNPKHYKMLDYLTFHYYPLFRKNFLDPTSIILNNDGTQNILGMLESVNLWDSTSYINKYDTSSPKGIAPGIIKKFQNWKSEYYPNAKLALTEFGVDSVSDISYHPIIRPLYLADLVARLGSAGVDTFVQSFLQGGNSGNPWAMINGTEKTRLYNVYSLFSNHFIGTTLGTHDTFGDKVNVYSVKTATGTNVILVNKDNKEHSTDISFKKESNLDSITQVNLPAWSVTLLSVPDNHSLMIKAYQYGAKEMGINISAR